MSDAPGRRRFLDRLGAGGAERLRQLVLEEQRQALAEADARPHPGPTTDRRAYQDYPEEDV
jgi:hypothetical protein